MTLKRREIVLYNLKMTLVICLLPYLVTGLFLYVFWQAGFVPVDWLLLIVSSLLAFCIVLIGRRTEIGLAIRLADRIAVEKKCDADLLLDAILLPTTQRCYEAGISIQEAKYFARKASISRFIGYQIGLA